MRSPRGGWSWCQLRDQVTSGELSSEGLMLRGGYLERLDFQVVKPTTTGGSRGRLKTWKASHCPLFI
jgi:hypothetical protein